MRPASSRPSRSVDVTELARYRDQSLLSALRRVRPRILERGRPTPTAPAGEAPAVYLDGVRQGGIQALEEIPVSRTLEVLRLSETEAFTRFALRHPGGAIVVVTR
jgi:hypothetical protein